VPVLNNHRAAPRWSAVNAFENRIDSIPEIGKLLSLLNGPAPIIRRGADREVKRDIPTGPRRCPGRWKSKPSVLTHHSNFRVAERNFALPLENAAHNVQLTLESTGP